MLLKLFIFITVLCHPFTVSSCVYCTVCDLPFGNLCLEECMGFSSALNAQSFHIPFLSSKQPFIARNHCFTDLQLASTLACHCAKSCFLSKHAPTPISPTSETAARLEWFCGLQSQKGHS